jgi:hypothetical protein
MKRRRRSARKRNRQGSPATPHGSNADQTSPPVHAGGLHSFCVYPFRSSGRLLFTMRPT